MLCRYHIIGTDYNEGLVFPPPPPALPFLAAVMQQPTCKNIRIRSARDAHRIFVAIQLGRLQMVNRRLDADERLALRPGCVYAWEERGPNAEVTGLGIERFTEGRHWSPSRVRDVSIPPMFSHFLFFFPFCSRTGQEFLFYHEKYVAPDSTRFDLALTVPTTE